MLTFGGGWGSRDGFSLNGSISDRNVFGGGKSISLNLEKTERTRKIETSIYNPRVNDSTYSLGVSFYINEVDYTNDTSTNRYYNYSKGFTVRTGKRLNRYWRSSLAFSHSENDVNYDTSTTLSKKYLYSGKTQKRSLTPYISFDDTNNYFYPTSGNTFSNWIEFVGFGSDQLYTKESFKYVYYYGLEDDYEIDLTFRYRLRGAVIFANVNDYKNFLFIPV